MKTSLTHLPDAKRYEISLIKEEIVRIVKPEMVILYGSYSRGDWVNDRHMEDDGILVEYKSDYDFLVVTSKPQDMPPGFGNEVRRKIKRAEKVQTIPHIIFHDLPFLNKELEEGQYFFADIVKEGILLYNKDNKELAQPRDLTPVEIAGRAQAYYNEWYKSASMFYENYESNSIKGLQDVDYYKIAIFELHQAAERFYKAIILVFTAYKPKTHDLDQLNKEVGYHDQRFKKVFPNQTEEEKRLFKVLVKAYIDSRYKMGYTVVPEELQWLGERVQMLKEIAAVVCKEKIEKLGN